MKGPAIPLWLAGEGRAVDLDVGGVTPATQLLEGVGNALLSGPARRGWVRWHRSVSRVRSAGGPSIRAGAGGTALQPDESDLVGARR